MRIIATWILNALALLAVAYLLPGIRVDGFFSALIAAMLLGLINVLLRPLLILLTLPVTFVTLGLFVLVINGLLFWFAGSVLKGFDVSGFWAGLTGSLLYSALSFILSFMLRKKNSQQGPVIIDHEKL
ncbi:MAG: phage holin family protein [Candidatus Nitrotoga sp.]|nr:phage holin family protein [Candidatus Nitrotoga sp.]MDW7534857.1 phage holin family protein [Candidatus Nitrotoga sp.]MDW7604128.1 phage holin family protein [Candidatus Nitrotoga sp.]MDW7613023.1 phage holin family protein [Candidatus Nitrotoga sp.]MDW7625384.1 phage holin family protein [Candidatus Nitrotoga sp.]